MVASSRHPKYASYTRICSSYNQVLSGYRLLKAKLVRNCYFSEFLGILSRNPHRTIIEVGMSFTFSPQIFFLIVNTLEKVATNSINKSWPYMGFGFATDPFLDLGSLSPKQSRPTCPQNGKKLKNSFNF